MLIFISNIIKDIEYIFIGETAMADKISEYLKNHRIHLIGNAHLDPAWLWRWTDGFAEVKATFQSALDRLDEYDDFIFTCAGACYYKWVEENCPSMFEEIRRRVSEGRWVIVGGWWIQPDCNIPSGESFVRHSLYSQRYYLEKFGVLCKTGYNVDSFGHSGMLPQILSKSGMDNYVFMRPDDGEKPDIPSVFNWQSDDGSSVLTFKIPISYNHTDTETLIQKIEKTASLGASQDTDMMLFYGVGNHGGGPTIAMINKIKELRKKYGDDKLTFSSPDTFMESVKEKAPNYQTIHDDLQIHAIGCYSAMLKIKKLNRKAETRLLSAESIDVLAGVLLDAKTHEKQIAAAWEKVMFNQFHDIICGCCIKTVYDDAQEAYGWALNTSEEILNGAAQKISWAVDTMGEDEKPRSKEDWIVWGTSPKGTPMVVFNPLPFERTVPVEANGIFEGITDSQNNLIPIQRVRSLVTNGEHDKWNTLFTASLPALGYRTFWLHKNISEDMSLPIVSDVFVADDGSNMSNSYTEICFDKKQGCITSILDKRTGEQSLKGPAAVGLVIDETESDTWGHGLWEYRDVVGCFSGASFDVIEKGPLRCRVRVTSCYNQSELVQDFLMYHDRPEIEVRVKIHWREKHKMLKLEFPVRTRSKKSTAEIPYGIINRPMDGTEKPIQQWIDVSDEKGGLTVINDSNYAADVKDGVIRLTVLRSPIYADHFGARDSECEFMEQGGHEVKYLLCPHDGGWSPSSAVRESASFNTPVFTVYETYHKGPLSQSLSGLNIAAENIIATVFKKAENGGGYVLRCHEAGGKAGNSRNRLFIAEKKMGSLFQPV